MTHREQLRLSKPSVSLSKGRNKCSYNRKVPTTIHESVLLKWPPTRHNLSLLLSDERIRHKRFQSLTAYNLYILIVSSYAKRLRGHCVNIRFDPYDHDHLKT